MVALLTLFTLFKSSAEEGMLIPSLISAFEDDMRAFGMKLSAEDIYSVNNSSLKDAILHFGGGCTAELVSSEGFSKTSLSVVEIADLLNYSEATNFHRAFQRWNSTTPTDYRQQASA